MIKKLLIWLAEKNGLIIIELSKMIEMEKIRIDQIKTKEEIIKNQKNEINNLKKRLKYAAEKKYL